MNPRARIVPQVEQKFRECSSYVHKIATCMAYFPSVCVQGTSVRTKNYPQETSRFVYDLRREREFIGCVHVVFVFLTTVW